MRFAFAIVLVIFSLGVQVQAATVPIVIDRILPDERPAAPVKFGVPFPQGELPVADVSTVRIIDDTGAVTPHQQAVTATWNPDGSAGVRWLLIDMLVDHDRTYTLQFGEAPAPTAQPQTDIARVEDGLIHIDNGPIRGAIRTDRFDPFSDLLALGMPMGLPPDAGSDDPMAFNGFYVEHETQGIFRADLGDSPSIVLEETGPIRATVKAEGWYQNPAGEHFCRYAIRMHFFRGRPDVKIEHTFIFTGLSAEDKIRSVSVQVKRMEAADASKMRGFVGDDNLREGRVACDISAGWVMQDQTERGRFDLMVGVGDEARTKVAHRGGGWITTIGGYSGMSVAIRDAWQQFPWEFELANGALRTHLWARHGRLLDTTWDGQWSMLTERQKRFLANQKQHKEENLDDWIARLRNLNATGVAKTHELWMSFIGPQYNAYKPVLTNSYPQLAREVAYPTVAHTDIAWQCKTRAMDWMPHAPYDLEQYRDEENFLDALLYTMQQAVEANNWYGWWDWGGYHQHLWVGPQLPRQGSWADDAGKQTWHRARPKSHYAWGGFSWIQYFRTGHRPWLRYGQTYTLYSADRAHCHFTGHGRLKGAEYHYDNSELPGMGGYQYNPSGDQTASNLQAKDDYVYQYWLTGDRRALDVLKNSGELLLATPAWTNYKPGFQRGNDIRNAGMLLHRTMLLYQATWDPRYLEMGRKLAAAFTPLQTPDQVRLAENNGPGSVFHAAAGWAYEGMWFYWNVTHDPAFEKTLKLYIDRNQNYDAGFPSTYGAMRTSAYGYLMTDDVKYLNLARASIDGLIGEGMTPWQFLPSGIMRLNTITRFLGATTVAPQAWRDANMPLHERGRSLGWRYATWNNNPALSAVDAVFLEKEDRPWSIDAVFNQGGHMAILRPDGQIAAEGTMDIAVNKHLTFNVPSDGMTGVYVLRCLEPSAFTVNNRNIEYIPEARVIRRDLPMMVAAGQTAQRNPVRGRALFVRVPAGTEGAAIQVADFDWRRPILLRVGDEPWKNMTAGDAIPLTGPSFVYNIAPADTDRVLGLRLGVAPDNYVDPRRAVPMIVNVKNLPFFVAANPEELFTP